MPNEQKRLKDAAKRLRDEANAASGSVEEYIRKKLEAARAAALEKSRTRTEPRVPPGGAEQKEIRAMQLDRYAGNYRKLAEEIAGTGRKFHKWDYSYFHNPVYDNLRYYNIGSDDLTQAEQLSEKMYERSDPEKARIALAMMAKDLEDERDAVKSGAISVNGLSCIATATDNYGNQYYVSGNQSFSSNPGKYGFIKIPVGDVSPGDLVQDIRSGHPSHALIFDGYNSEGRPLFNYSDGGEDESSIVKSGVYFPGIGGFSDSSAAAYRFVGTPADSTRWKQEYESGQFGCGGKKYPGGGKFFRTNLQNESPLMYQPMVDINYPIETPLRFRPEPDLGDYRAPESTGMIVNYPINLPSRTPVVVRESIPAPMVVEGESIGDLFSEEAKARRLLRQRYAESVFDDKAVSNAGARGAWQIMPITYKDYLTRGRGKEGDLDDPDYNRLVRDHTFRMIPRDLEEIWDENYSGRNKLALLYAGYNRGANGLKKYLRGLVKKGVDISKPENWVEGMNPETRNYVHFLAYDEDVPGTYLMNEKFENAARERGYMANGGRLFEDGGPEKTYQDYLDEYRSAKAALGVAKKDEQAAKTALRDFRQDYTGPDGSWSPYWYWTPEGKRLDAESNIADKKLEEARNAYFSASDNIGNATLEKYRGTSSDPMAFWEGIATTKEGAEKYFRENAIRESAGAQEVADYFKSYANSPGYARIRNNQEQWWKQRHPYKKIYEGTGRAMGYTDSLQSGIQVSPYGVFDLSVTPQISKMRMRPKAGMITVGTNEEKDWPYWFVLPHEMAHIANTFSVPYFSAQAEALSRNTNTSPGHDSELEEKHSDKEAMMFLLYKEGIYDSRGDKDCTPEDIAKLREKYPGLRPLKQMDNEKAAWMINHVADAGEQESLYDNHLGNISASGGKIRIKPSHRGRLTELKERTGKTEAELYDDGNPAHKRMVVFARNSRKWEHGDGGSINQYDGETEETGWLRRFLNTPTRVPNMTGTATAAATGLRDIPLTDSTVGRELAVAGTAMLPLAPYLGHSAAVGIDTMGRMAMPSTLLKGVSYYAPKAAGALSAVSPWLDAGALSLWSAEAGKAAIDAGKRGDTGNAIGYGALAALPVVMPLVMKAYSAIKSVPNLPDIEKEGKIAYRVIDDAGLSDIINSGIIRPNQAGPYAHSGVQGGTWFSLDKPATHRHPTVLPNGNTVSYRGNYVIEIGEKSPQFPTGTTPGTVDLNYRLGAMEIDPRDPRIRIYDRRRGKYLKPEDYTVNAKSDKLLWETPPVVSTAAETTPAIVQKSVEQVVPKYEISDLGGGYMLKSLMRGNPLEKQISKNGTVNVNNVRALVGKGSKVEQAVVDKVLASEEFAGKKSIDYNKFRKAVQDELITYERTPDTRWENYGGETLNWGGSGNDIREWALSKGYYKPAREKMPYDADWSWPSEFVDTRTGKTYTIGALEPLYKKEHGVTLNTYTFSSPRIPNGSGKHYDPNTLGHSRTYTTADEPDVLHVMESQSDWGQGYKKMNLDGEYNQKRINSLERRINNLKESINSEMEGLRTEKMNDGSDMSPWFADSLRKQIEKDKQLLGELTVELDMRRNPKLATQQDYLAENFTSRQIQENLRYAAEKGQTKMRYPTRETAAKIEGYPEVEMYIDERGIKHDTPYEYDQDIKARLDDVQRRFDEISRSTNESDMPEYERLARELGELSDAYANSAVPIKNAKKVVSYVNEHEGILKKYDAFPKQYKKLYKNADVRIVTDPKGNTWYEVDVPENYLQQEWAYEEGGSLILPKMMMDKHSPDKLRKAIANIRARKKK